jgi:hypothetical protein
VSLQSLVQAVKFINCHPFHFKFSHYIYTPLYIPEKKSRTSPRVSEPRCNSDLVSRLHTSSLALNIVLLDFALPRSLSLSHALTSLSHAFALPCFALALPRFVHSRITRFASLIAIGIAHHAHCNNKNSFYLNSLIIGRVTHPLAPLSPHLK